MRISGVSERDIDLLLLEEFIASQEFQRVFLTKCCIKDTSYHLIDAQRSVTDSTGESDLEIKFKNREEQTLALLIENKVNANFQKNQQKRYCIRGENYIKNGTLDSFLTVLIAPKSYHSDQLEGFDFRVNYEDVLDYFESNDAIGDRKKYKVAILQSAINKGSSGYQQVADQQVTQFWYDYWKIAQDIAPELTMEKPANKPSASSFIYFNKNSKLPNDVSLVHKLTHGHFDLQFKDMGDKLDQMHCKYAECLDKGMSIDKAAKSASIRVSVPTLSLADTVESQKKAVMEGMLKGKALLQWFSDQK